MSLQRTSFAVLLFCGLSSVGIQGSGGEVAVRWVAINRADQVPQLPADNIARFTAESRQVSVSLDMLGSADGSTSLAGTNVTVVDSLGATREFTANANGVITIDEVSAGPHAIVASTDNAHGASLFVFEPSGQDAIGAELISPQPARMTLMSISGEGLMPLIDDYLTVTDSSPFADDDREATLPTGSSFGYQVEIGPNGELNGQVTTIAAGDRTLAGVTIVILKNGQPVARDVTDVDGRFAMKGVRPGVHGLVAAGPAGYAAFAFDAVSSDSVTRRGDDSPYRLVSTMMAPATTLPVALIPSSFVPAVVNSIQDDYPAVSKNSVIAKAKAANAAAAGNASASPSNLSAISSGAGSSGAGMNQPFGAMAGGAGGGGGSAGFGGGGLGGIGALGAIGAVVAGVAINNDNDRKISVPGTVISPSS